MFLIEYLDKVPVLIKIIEHKKELYLNYQVLYSLLTDKNMLKSVNDIMKEEEKHYNKFYGLYEKIVGSPPVELKRKNSDITDFNNIINSALTSEIDLIDIYKNMFMTMQNNNQIRDMLFDTILDEIKHVSILNWIHSARE